MALADGEKAAMRAATHEAALVLLDDLGFIRTILSKQYVTAGDVRRSAVLLRRLLLEREIGEVAAPRVGRLMFDVPPYEEQPIASADKWEFYVTAGAPMFQLPINVIGAYYAGCLDPEEPNKGGGLILPHTDGPPARSVRLHLDAFMSDQIGRFKGSIVRRRDIIKFICYKGHGVHSNGKDEPLFHDIKHFRYALTMRNTPKGPYLATSDLGVKPLGYVSTDIDVVLLQMFSTAYYLCHSTMVEELEGIIASEA